MRLARRGLAALTVEPEGVMVSDSRRQDLLRRMRQPEDRFVERKAGVQRRDVIEALVAFANSTPSDGEAILFLGVEPDATPRGLPDADRTQREVRKWAEHECFPSIDVASEVVRIDDLDVLAVVVKGSARRPHVAGHPFLRIGSETVKARPDEWRELLASSIGDVARILEFRSRQIFVRCYGARPNGEVLPQGIPYSDEVFEVLGCDAQSVQLRDMKYRHEHSVSLRRVELIRDQMRGLGLMLVYRPQ